MASFLGTLQACHLFKKNVITRFTRNFSKFFTKAFLQNTFGQDASKKHELALTNFSVHQKTYFIKESF